MTDQPDYSEFYQQSGDKHQLDPDLLRAVADTESNQDRFAVSPAGAQGLMQLMPGTAGEVGVKDAFAPGQSIDGGATYLRRMLDHPRNKGDITQALAAYNAGPGGDYSNPETTNYVSKVMDRWDGYRQRRWGEAKPAAHDDWVVPKDDDWTVPEEKPNATASAPDTGYYDAVKQGVLSPLTGAGQTYQALTTGRPGESTAPKIAAAEPMTLADLKNPRILGEKALYSFGASAPDMAGFFLGSVPGGGPTTPTGMGTGAIGAAIAHTATTFGPIFGAELQATPDNPDAAFTRAYQKTGVGAAATALGFGAFGAVNPFSSALKNLAFQTFGLQPVIGMAEHEATNALDGKPLGEGVLDEYPGQVMGGVATLAGFEGAKAGYHGVRAGVDALRNPTANPALAGNIQQQQAAAAAAQAGQAAPQQGPPGPMQGPPPAPQGPPPPPQGPPPPQQGPPPPANPAANPAPQPANPAPRTPQQTLGIIAGGGDPAKIPPPAPPPVAPPAAHQGLDGSNAPEAVPPQVAAVAAPRAPAQESSPAAVQPPNTVPPGTVEPAARVIKPIDMLANVRNTQKWTDIGQNADGQRVYEDPNGVRSTLEAGIRSTESVTRVPGEGYTVRAPAEKAAQYQVVAPQESNPVKLGSSEPAEMNPVSVSKPTPEVRTLPDAQKPEAPQESTPAKLGSTEPAEMNPVAAVPAPDEKGWPVAQSPDDPLLANNVDRLRAQYGGDGLMSRMVAQMLHEGDAKPGGVARNLDAKRMQQAAEMVYGGRLADNAFSRDRMYDAMETGVNRYIAQHPERFAPTGDATHAKGAAEALAEIKNRMPTQTVRAGDKDKLQQFSTPPEYAFAAAWAANLKPTDHVMEPSAGNGGLLVHALTAGVAETTGNEISQHRLTNLRDQGFTRVTNENAEQLHNILPPEIRPTAVVMNPPFSSAGDRMGGKMVLGVGSQHIEQALQRLEPGGRLVAIVGRGMSMDAPTFKGWWNKIGSQYDVRANVGVGGGIYRKYGTTFGTRVLVIDKVAPTGRAVVRNDVEGVDGLIDKLKGVRDDRPALGGDRSADQPITGEPTRQTMAGEGANTGEPAGIVRDPTGDMGLGGSGDQQRAADEPVRPAPGGRGTDDLPAADAGTEANPPGDAVPVEQPEHEPGGTASQPEPRPDDGGDTAGRGSAGAGDPARPDGVTGGLEAGDHTRPDGSDINTPPPPDLVKTGVIVPDAETGGELTESVYEPYKPQRVQIEGAKPHPGALVQSAAMASVLPPAPKYNTAIPKKLITSGALSDAQLEAIIYAGEAHGQMLPPDAKGVEKRRGFFIGDGCVAAGTRIFNPITGEHTAIEDLVGRKHTVLSLTPDGFAPATAVITFRKGEADLYRVVMDDGRAITVTAQHRFLTPAGWATLQGGVDVGGLLACRDAAISTAPATHAADVLHAWRTPEDCLGENWSDHHLYDEPPQWAAGNGQVSFLRLDGVSEHSRSFSHGDDPAPTQAYSDHGPVSCHRSRNNSAAQASRGHESTSAPANGVRARSSMMTHPVSLQFLSASAWQRVSVDQVVSDQPAHACDLSRSLSEDECHAYEAGRRLMAASRHSEVQVLLSGCHPSSLGSSSGPDRAGSTPVSCAWRIITEITPVSHAAFYDMYVPGPENYVAEGFVNHNTGVGKGRETAGIILDNWMKGNRKAVWVSDKMALGNDAKRDWQGLGGDPGMLMPHNKTKASDPITHKEGVLFTSYDTLRSEEKIKTTTPTRVAFEPGTRVSVATADPKERLGATLVKGGAGNGDWTVRYDDGRTATVPQASVRHGSAHPQSRVDQIVSWLGKDFDGVIAFDESHNLSNAVATRGARGVKGASLKAIAGIELQDRLPKARVIYVSATGATEVSNLAYADRLGLWGAGTAFADRGDFIAKIGSGGVAAMELVARDMKSLGQYMARSLSYDGVEYDRILHPLNPDQTVMYDKIADAWQTVMANFEAAIATTESGGKGGVSAGVKSAFWGGHQRFFNQLITSMQMPSVIEGVERDMAEGRQAVLQLVNTNEAATDRALDQNRTETGGDDLEELDLSPKAQLLQLVEKAFPTKQYEKFVDENGSERVRPVLDAAGKAVHSREALAAKEALLDDLATLRVPDGPLDLLFNHFGPDAVAEVTGRKQRVVNRRDENGVVRRVEEKRGGQDNLKEAKDFQDAKKKLLVFSEAGGTGRSYHAAIGTEGAGNRRSHYLVQAGWRADKAVQGFGRTHRTNQESAPIFHLVTTDLEGQKRFISSIARRLGQLGALTKGERKTGDQGMFGLQDNLEADEAKAALTQLYRDVVADKVDGITDATTFKKMGLSLIDPKTGGLRQDPPPMTQFLNRLLSLRSGEQNQLFDAFNTRFADTIDRAQQAGTLDAGTETLRADKITKKSDQTVYTDPNTGAETKHVHLETHTKNNPASFDDIEAGQSRLTGNQKPVAYVRNTRSGRISAVAETTYAKVEAGGQITEHYRVANPLEGTFQVKADITKAQREKRIEVIHDRAEAKKLWDAQVAATPAYKTADLHMITGAVLPIWDRLTGVPKIYRLQTEAGERLLGRVVDNREIQSTLKRLGAEGQQVTASPAEVGQKIMQGSVATLANGWTIKRSLVAGQQRLELKGWGYRDADQLLNDGLFRERIGSDVRLFIPGDTAGEVIGRITARRPVTELTGSSGDEQYSARPAPEEDTGQFAKRRRSTEDEAVTPRNPAPIQPAQADLHAAMRQMMRFVGLPDSVGLKFVDKISRGGPNGADAVYDKGLITYALDTTAGEAPVKLWHEAVHALMDPTLGLLKPGELKALGVGADRWLHDGKRGLARRVELQALHYTEAQYREEAIARMAEDALERGVRSNSLLGGAIERMRNFGRGLGQVFRGQGFKTADDVFNGLMRGDRAAPGAIEAMRQSAIPPANLAPKTANPADGDSTEPVKPAQPPAPQASARPYDAAIPPEGHQSLSEILAGQTDERYAARRSPVQMARDAGDDVAKLFSPTSRGADAKATELTIRGRWAKLAQSSAQTGAALEAFRHAVAKLPIADQLGITDAMERGLPQQDPAMQPVADALRGELDKWTRMIQSLGTGKLDNANADYMGRAYSNYQEWSQGNQAAPGNQAAGLAGQIAAGSSKRPIRGSGNFLKQRSFDFQSDAVAAGLTPVSANPLEMQTLKLREMQRYYHGQKLANELKGQGIARWVTTERYGEARANDLVPLDDKIFQPKVPDPQHGLTEHGKWMAPEPAARLFNNFVSEGLRGNTLYDMTRSLGNALNSLQLGLSAFHATFISLDTMISRVALGLQQVARGDVGRGLVNAALGMSPHNIARAISQGSKLRSAYLDPLNATPEWRKLADALNAGGGRINMDQFYRSNASGSFFKNMTDLKNPGSVMREARLMARDSPLTLPLDLASRVIDTSMEPIMGQMVPRAKLGVFADLAADWQRRNPLATPEDTAAAMTKAWDSVDNRMGQLVYDNMFWHKVSKDVAFISTRSVGWNLGTIRELGGGLVDAARGLNDAAHLRTPEFTTRMAYLLAMPIQTAVLGAVLTYAYTGAAPTSMLDYFYPPNGQSDGGRNSIPGYIKDVVAYARSPVQTLLNKLHPLFSMASQIHQNRDYRGGIIYNPQTDNPAYAYAEYLLNTAMPFSIQAMRKNDAEGATMFDKALSFFGIQPAPQSVVNPGKMEKYEAQQNKRATRSRAKEGLWRPFSGQ